MFYPEYSAGPILGTAAGHWAHPQLLGPAAEHTENEEVEHLAKRALPTSLNPG